MLARARLMSGISINAPVSGYAVRAPGTDLGQHEPVRRRRAAVLPGRSHPDRLIRHPCAPVCPITVPTYRRAAKQGCADPGVGIWASELGE